FLSFLYCNFLNGQSTAKGIAADTIIQNFHHTDNIQPTKKEALIRLKVMDFKKQALEGIPLWVYQKGNSQCWHGITDERGEAIFLLPNNADFTVNVDQETDYRKFNIPKEANLS